MNQGTPTPWGRGPVRIFIATLALLWLVQIGANLAGFRIIRPNLEKAEDHAVYGRPYTHK
jgi:hypothetical protein